jgi:transcriptional regulator of NAD metabolism
VNATASTAPATRPDRLGGEARRAAMLRTLDAGIVMPGDRLAARFGVSRQAIVHDVAVLRAAGAPIVATVRGYVLASAGRSSAVVAVRHAPEEAIEELTAIVDLGVEVVDVVVEHPVYGELRTELRLASRADVAAWAEATARTGAHLLSELTGGIHLHTLEATDPARLGAARAALARLGFLLVDGAPDA